MIIAIPHKNTNRYILQDALPYGATTYKIKEQLKPIGGRWNGFYWSIPITCDDFLNLHHIAIAKKYHFEKFCCLNNYTIISTESNIPWEKCPKCTRMIGINQNYTESEI